MVFGVESASGGRFLLVVDYLIEQGVHENDDLDILLDGLFQNMQFGLIDRIRILVVILQKLGVAGQ
jgi:hypothetical protein